MLIGQISGATRTIGQHQGYQGLPLRDETFECFVNRPDTPVMHSAWFPTFEELAALALGAPIILSVVGNSHPPVLISVGETPDRRGQDACGSL